MTIPGDACTEPCADRPATPADRLTARLAPGAVGYVRFVSSAASSDRRSDARTRGIRGTAVALTRLATLEFAIENLSTSGMLLVGRRALPLGEQLRLLVHLEREPSLGVTVQVARIDVRQPGHCKVAVIFCEVDRTVRQRIHQLVVAALRRDWIAACPAVLVVDDDAAIRDRMEQELGGYGLLALRASTAAEVMDRLQDPSVQVGCALVATQLARVNTVALLGVLADEYPTVRRVLLLRVEPAPASWAASTNTHAYLSVPWEPTSLLSAIGFLFAEQPAPSSTEP